MSNYLQLYWKEQDKITRGHGERLGQWFCNRFITYSWPELYYADHDEAFLLISEWLTQHQYEDTIPPYTQDWKMIKFNSEYARR